MFTTLNEIRKFFPCQTGWEKLLRSLGKTAADDEPLSLLAILDSNGIDDAIWAFKAVKGYEKEKRLFAVACCREVQHLMTDPRSVAAVDAAEKFANGEISERELRKAAVAAASYFDDDASVIDAAAAAAYYVTAPVGAPDAASYYAAHAADAIDAAKEKQAEILRNLLLGNTN